MSKALLVLKIPLIVDVMTSLLNNAMSHVLFQVGTFLKNFF